MTGRDHDDGGDDDNGLVSVDVASMSQYEAAVWMMEQATLGLQSAKPGSVAYTHSMKEVRTARALLDEIRERDKANQPKQALSPEQRRTALEAKAVQMPLPDLELLVSVYCGRVGARVVPND
jgi:hypothetical protein